MSPSLGITAAFGIALCGGGVTILVAGRPILGACVIGLGAVAIWAVMRWVDG